MTSSRDVRWRHQIGLVRFALALVFCLALPASPGGSREKHPLIDATGRFAGKYICEPTASAGFIFEKEEGGWEGRGNLVNYKTLFISVEALSPDLILFEHILGRLEEWHVMRYSIKIRIADDDVDLDCYDSFRGGNIIDTIPMGLAFQCSQMFFEYKINLTTLRYIEYYAGGFLMSDGSSAGGPFMSIGTCTKIDN